MTLLKGEVGSSTTTEVDSSISRKGEGAYNLLLHILGSPGRYQVLLLCLLGVGVLSVTINDFVAIFYAVTPVAIYCKIPEHVTRLGLVPDCIFQANNSQHPGSLTDLQTNLQYLPVEMDPDFCVITPMQTNWSEFQAGPESTRCTGWYCQYDVQHNFSHPREWSVIAQWGLECGYYWLFTLSLVLYFTGAVVGTLIFDMLTKRLGYKSNIWVWSLMCIVLCVGFGFEKTFWLFALMRFLLGLVGHGFRYACLRLMFDLLPSEQRLGAVAAVAFSSSAGLLLLGVLAYFIMDWRFILYGALLFSLVGLTYQWTVPESLKWLLSHSQTLQAQQVFYRFLAKNRQFVPAGLDATIAGASNTLVHARQNDQSWRITLRNAGTARPLIALVGLCFVSNLVNYGVLLSLPSLGGNIYLMVMVCGFLDICGLIGGLFLLRKMALCRIIFITIFMGGLLCLTGGLIPGGLPKTNTVEITRTALILLGRVSIAIPSSFLLEMFFRVLPTSCHSAGFGLHGAIAMTGALFGSMFTHMGKADHQVPFLIFGLLSVTTAFFTFVLPVDDFVAKPAVDPQELADRETNNTVELQDEEELVFEPLPEMTRSPYVL